MANLTATSSDFLLEIQGKATFMPPVFNSSIYQNVGLLVMTGSELSKHREKTSKNGNLELIGSGWFNFEKYPINPDKTYFIKYRVVPKTGHSFVTNDTKKFVGMDALRLKCEISEQVPEKLDGLWNLGDAEWLKWDSEMAIAKKIVADCRDAHPNEEGYVSIEDTADGMVAKWNARQAA